MTNHSKTFQDLPMRFWGLLGPFLILLILAVYLFKVPSASPFMPLLGGAGLVLCCGWRVRGLAAALLLIALFLAISYPSVPLQEKFWFVGISLAFGLAFVVTTLSLEEVDSALARLSKDASRGWSQLKNLDQKRVAEEDSWKQSKQTLEVDLEWTKEKLETHKSECSELKQKVESFHAEKMRLLEDVKTERAACVKLEQERDSLQFQLKNQNSKIEEAQLCLQRDRDAFEVESRKLRSDLEQSKELFARSNREKERLHEQLQNLSTRLHELSKEPQKVERDPFEPLYKQLRAQFEEKNQLLSETRRELFWAQEKLTVLEREVDEVTQYDDDSASQRFALDLSNWVEELELESEIASLEREVVSSWISHSVN